MGKKARIALTGFSFALFGVLSAALTLLLPLALLVQLFWPARARLPQRQRWISGLCRWLFEYARVIGLMRFDRAERPDWGEGARVLVANHPSLIDVLLILTVVPEARCMVGASWFRHPLLGAIMRAGGHFSGPSRRVEVGEESGAVDALVSRLKEGATVLIFPEGTRSPPGGLRRFRLGAAEAAIRAGVPIVPLKMGCDPPVLSKDRPWYDIPACRVIFSLAFLPPVDPGEGVGAAELTRKLKGLYQA